MRARRYENMKLREHEGTRAQTTLCYTCNDLLLKVYEYTRARAISLPEVTYRSLDLY